MIRAYLVVNHKTHLLNFLYYMCVCVSLSLFRCFSSGADARAKRKMNYAYELHSNERIIQNQVQIQNSSGGSCSNMAKIISALPGHPFSYMYLKHSS